MEQNFSQAGTLKSMTAYGRGASSFAYGRFIIEIQSLNRRYLEINLSLPRALSRFDVGIRKNLALVIARGALSVNVSWKSEAKQPISVVPNIPLAKGIKAAWEKMVNALELSEPFPTSLLFQEKDLFLYEEEIIEEESYQAALDAALHDAIEALLEMKRREGEALVRDLAGRLLLLEQEIDYIATHAQDGCEKYRRKLSDRLEELFSGSAENEEKILREVAIYADRVDITEETVRFKSHLGQFHQLVSSPLENELEARGKVMDFLLQELLREANTIGSKTSEVGISQRVIAIKSLLEKIREQVQNIE